MPTHQEQTEELARWRWIVVATSATTAMVVWLLLLVAHIRDGSELHWAPTICWCSIAFVAACEAGGARSSIDSAPETTAKRISTVIMIITGAVMLVGSTAMQVFA